MHRTIRLATAAVSAGVALMAAVAAAFGVFARGDGTFDTVTSSRGEVYEMATTGVYAFNGRQLVAEGIGWDVFTLGVVAPAMLAAALCIARGSYRGTLAAAGLLGYLSYLYLEYAVTWAFGPLTPLFIVLLAGSVIALIGTAALLAQAGIAGRFGEDFPRKGWATLSLGMAALLTVMWIGRIATGLGMAVPELHGESTMTVQVLDLGIVIPAAVLLGVLALRRHPIGLVASAAFAVTFTTMTAAIGAMMVSASIVNDALQGPPLVVFGFATVAGAIVSVRIFRSARPPAVSSPATALRAPGTTPVPEST